MLQNPRQLAFLALRAIHHGAYADIALDRTFRQAQWGKAEGRAGTLAENNLAEVDRRLVTEIVYGSVRRKRTLDALIDRLATKKSDQQPADLRLILHIGLYQLRYLNHIPASAAVNTTVELAKQNGFQGLAGFVNGLLRQYVRLEERRRDGSRGLKDEQLSFSSQSLDPIADLAIQYSYPDWIVAVWMEQFGYTETEQLCHWLNQPPHIDLRVNILRASVAEVEAAMHSAGIAVQRLPGLPQALRLPQGVGVMQNLPGFVEGWWTVQDGSAQLVGHLLDPQPGERVMDACAAPGGKTTHLAELMQDQGTVWAIDRHGSRLKKLQQNTDRLQLKSIQICPGDSRNLPQFTQLIDRVLLDAPCSGLGTLHRHADARWRQTPETVAELAQLQTELLQHTATWVKPGGILVYATCTLHPAENESVIQRFLAEHPQWQIDRPALDQAAAQFVTEAGWLKVLPHRQNMDGFFVVRLKNQENQE
jgi:16S rRNA (cytosine967-C5)-methyltransferase